MLYLSQSLPEILARSLIGFVGLVLLVRIMPKRNTGRISPKDMIVLILIGSIGADAVSGGSSSVGDLMIMIAAVLLLAYGLDVLEFHSPLFRRLMRHQDTILIRDGMYQRRNMRRELVTEEELRSALRVEGIEEVEDVKLAVLEADGEISVIRRGAGPGRAV
ncbi:MAG TPA: DUF421 domain-containing protein [Paracoccus sp.]|nr:DUF421 domain-containing protein [Paracoccus sp. (in: a-proteobacteria)]